MLLHRIETYCAIVRHPRQAGGLIEWDRLKGGCPRRGPLDQSLELPSFIRYILLANIPLNSF